jgi:predicted kinase
MMPKLYMLVGVPGSGKSTWVSDQEWAGDCAYISTDRYVEEFAKNMGKTYSEVFEEVMPECVNLMAGDVVNAREAGQDIIWDQTSTTVSSRKKKFRMLPEYHAIAVIFKTPSRDELDRRLQSRYDSGKIIPKEIVDSMIDNWEDPTEEEGFKEIWITG